MITHLNESDLVWINLCKFKLMDKYPWRNTWLNTIEPLFLDRYGWDPLVDGNYSDYMNTLFKKLLGLYMKIRDEEISNTGLKEIFEASFSKRISNSAELPIERAINVLCNLIQFTPIHEM